LCIKLQNTFTDFIRLDYYLRPVHYVQPGSNWTSKAILPTANFFGHAKPLRLLDTLVMLSFNWSLDILRLAIYLTHRCFHIRGKSLFYYKLLFLKVHLN